MTRVLPQNVVNNVRWMTVVGVLLFVLFRVLYAQDTAHGIQDAVQDAHIYALDQRVAHIEAVHPDALLERVSAIEKKQADQQTLLWGILIAVLVNVITGGGLKLPFKK